MAMGGSVSKVVDYEYKVSGAQQASSQMESIGDSGTAAAVGLAAATTAAVIATKAFYDMTVESAGVGANLFNTAAAANVTAEDIQALNYVLLQTTGQSDAAANSLRTINNFMLSAGEGATRQTEALERMNLQYSDLEAMDPAERFIAITDAIGGITDATDQNLTATAVFGTRYSTQIVAALNQTEGSMSSMMDTFNDSSMAISTEHVNALKTYDDSLTNIETQMTALKGTIAAEVAPEMEDLTGIVQELIPLFAEELKSAIPAVKDAITNLGENIKTYGPVVLDFIGLTIDLIVKLNEANTALSNAGRIAQAFGTAGISEAVRGRGELSEANQMLIDQDKILTDLWTSSYADLVASQEPAMTGWAGISGAIQGATASLAGYASEYVAAQSTVGSAGPITSTTDPLGLDKMDFAERAQMLQDAEIMAIENIDAKRAEIAATHMQREQEVYTARLQALQGVADQSIGIIIGGFEGGFSSVLDGFRNMLADMASEWLKSQIVGALFGAGGKALGGFL